MRVRSFRRSKEKWPRGSVTKVCCPRTYVVSVAGARRYVHVDHIISANAPSIDEPAVVNRKEQSGETNR